MNIVLRPDRPRSKGMLADDGFDSCFAPAYWPANEAVRISQTFAPLHPLPRPPPSQPNFESLMVSKLAISWSVRR